MEKRYLSPLELITNAMHHAYAADFLLGQCKTFDTPQTTHYPSQPDLVPIISLMYHAFCLAFKAFYLQEGRFIKEHKTLIELVELNAGLNLSRQEQALLKKLSQAYLVFKGVQYDLWENAQQEHIFCKEILNLFGVLQKIGPLELQADYYI